MLVVNSPMEKEMTLHWTDWYFLQSKIFCAIVGWNKPHGSWFRDFKKSPTLFSLSMSLLSLFGKENDPSFE